jgi:hypothetical protein
MIIHKSLTLERWFQFTLMEQLANIGTDIARVYQWRKEGNLDFSNKALDRAFELLEATMLDPKNQGHRLKEIVLMNLALKDHFLLGNEYNTTEESWQDYFFQFNYAAAMARGR